MVDVAMATLHCPALTALEHKCTALSRLMLSLVSSHASRAIVLIVVLVCLHCINFADRLLLHLIKVSDDGKIILLLLLRVKGECSVMPQRSGGDDSNENDLMPS